MKSVDVMAGGAFRSPGEALLGSGVATRLPDLLREHRHALFVTDPVMAQSPHCAELVRRVRGEGLKVTLLADTVPEVPLSSVVLEHRVLESDIPDVVVGFGGGSVLDRAKVLAATIVDPSVDVRAWFGENRVCVKPLPLVAIPTTAGTGSEATPVAVLLDTEASIKVGISSPILLPWRALVDPLVMAGCPGAVAAASGMDAISHALESLTASRASVALGHPTPVFTGATPITQSLGLTAFSLLAPHLGAVALGLASEGDWAAMATGSFCAGLAFGNAGTHLGHALQYPVGAETGTSHGVGVGLLLPHVMRFVRDARSTELANAADLLGFSGTNEAKIDQLLDWLAQMPRRVGAPSRLRDIGLRRERIPALAAQAQSITRLIQNSPIPAGRAELSRILERAW